MAVLGIERRPLVAERVARARLIGVQRVLDEPRHAADNRILMAAGAANRAAHHMRVSHGGVRIERQGPNGIPDK